MTTPNPRLTEQERMQAVYEAALAWERARQYATEPGLTVERNVEEMVERRLAYSEREKELRSLLRTARSEVQS